jgi:hypothetical protein
LKIEIVKSRPKSVDKYKYNQYNFAQKYDNGIFPQIEIIEPK